MYSKSSLLTFILAKFGIQIYFKIKILKFIFYKIENKGMVYTGMLNSRILIGYNSISDIVTIILCMVIMICLYDVILRDKSKVNIYNTALISLALSASSNLVGYTAEKVGIESALNISQIISLSCLYCVMFMYLCYIKEILRVIKHFKQLKAVIISSNTIIVFTMCLQTFINTNYSEIIQQNNIILFFIGYIIDIIIITTVILIHRKEMIAQVYKKLLVCMCIAMLVIVIEIMKAHTSFLVITFLIPILAMIILTDSESFDINTGSLGIESFERILQHYIKNDENVNFISFYLPLMEYIDKSLELQDRICAMHKKLENIYLFRLSGSKFISLIDNKDNDIDKLVQQFYKVHNKYKMDYKMVIGSISPKLKNGTDYLKLIQFVENTSYKNTETYITDEIIDQYIVDNYVLKQLKDIDNKMDLDDNRVKVYCQPIYNSRTKSFRTAEALMRLELDGKIYFPDKFIPIAEQYNYIHSLSLIILNKVCKIIKNLVSTSYDFDTISVNFSIAEIYNRDFSKDIIEILEKNNIDYHNIAIEITESKYEGNFNIVSESIEELRNYGMLIYLDDFGTGYSNLDRIMKLPFNVIKFDKSLLSSFKQNTNLKYMVSQFSELFKKLGYTLLFEGVEDETDEKICLNLDMTYMQGYKYSRPIEIERLTEFFKQYNT